MPADTAPQVTAEERADKAELKLTRLKERYKLAGIILGTSVVSIIGSWLVFAEATQRNSQDYDQGHREFVAQFVEHAISEDVETRQRLARYFATVTLDDKQRQLWVAYANYVDNLIETNRKRLAELQEQSKTADEVQLLQLQQEIDLLRRQLGASSAAVLTFESESCNARHDAFPARWMCIARAEETLGVQEIPGPEFNPRILEYAEFAEQSHYTDDDIPWSGLFVAWVAAQSGVPRKALPQNPLANRKWLDFGDPAETPSPGDIAVFWRRSPDSMAGHVGFFVREEEDRVYIISGNTSNAVRTVGLPKERLLGFRTFPME